ncbi:MAG: LPS export ABC transporter periplasmic protein LptC [candidate division Zixibacteria bacterium]|nr:LPS export ABC transporter periplasmic protein LptC [candidate division Zixibacteria bacterium]
MMRIRFGLFFVAVLAAGWLFACSSENAPSGDQAGITDSALLPDSDLRGARIYLYDKGQVTTEIRADKIIKFEKQDSTVAFRLDIDVFDSLGQVSTVVTGDSGVIREAHSQLFIYSNVVVETADSVKLETEFLFWNSATNRIQAPADVFVKVTRGQDIMTGYGLEADQKLSSIKILRPVSGTIYDTKEIDEL